MREHNTCSPIFFPPQICHGRRMRFINACCKNRCASLPPQGGGHGVFQRVFRRLSGILIGRECRNRFPKTRSPCDLRVRGLRTPCNVEKISARFVLPRWYPEVGIGLLNGGLKGFLNRVRRYERVGIAR